SEVSSRPFATGARSMTAYLDALGLLCALGDGCQQVADNLARGDRSGMHAQRGWVADLALTVGAVEAALPAVPTGLEDQDTRNNRLLLAAAQQIEGPIAQAIAQFGAARIGVVLGTS